MCNRYHGMHARDQDIVNLFDEGLLFTKTLLSWERKQED